MVSRLAELLIIANVVNAVESWLLRALIPSTKNMKPQAPEFLTKTDLAKALGMDLSELSFWVNGLDPGKRYNTFEITAKNKRKRKISAPIPPIMAIQRELSELLTPAYVPRVNIHGYIPGRSAFTNAKIHQGQMWVVHVDIKDFFPSITYKRIYGLFRAFPFHYSKPVAWLLAQICSHENGLPQGAPTSPLISNLICRSLDSRMVELANNSRCYYSRYCDDFTFSTATKVIPIGLAVHNIEKIFQSEGFELQPSKTTRINRNEHQMVTGLTVNRFVNVPRKYIRSVRNLLFIWQTYGESAAQASFDKLWQRNRPPGKDDPTLKQIVRGRIQYIGSVKGWYDPVYRRLAQSFEKIDSDYKPTNKDSDRPMVNLIIRCEGKTDVDHLKAAWRYFKNDYPQINPEFHSSNGDGNLSKQIKTLQDIHQYSPVVGFFDRDNDWIIKEYAGTVDGSKTWSHGVYSMVLPTPKHRDDKDSLCIELMHLPATLAINNGKKRIFQKSEFNDDTFLKTDGSAIAPYKTEKSGLIETKVRDLISQENIALSKDDFSKLILDKKPPFDNVDFSGFKVIFDEFCNVRKKWLQDKA